MYRKLTKAEIHIAMLEIYFLFSILIFLVKSVQNLIKCEFFFALRQFWTAILEKWPIQVVPSSLFLTKPEKKYFIFRRTKIITFLSFNLKLLLLFQIFYQNYSSIEPKILNLPNCGTFCPLEKFLSLYQQYIPDDETIC